MFCRRSVVRKAGVNKRGSEEGLTKCGYVRLLVSAVRLAVEDRQWLAMTVGEIMGRSQVVAIGCCKEVSRVDGPIPPPPSLHV